MFGSKKGPLGLTVLAPLSYADNPGQCDIDIVAVHGLRGDSIHSWTADNCCWIRDLLPRSCSTARIMTYGYNANVFADLASGRIADYADDLLAELHGHRDHDQARERPLVFICHSMGGIVVKKALIKASLSRDIGHTYHATSSVAFFGTPHRGLSQASYASLANRLISAARLTSHNEAPGELQAFSNCLVDINSEFVHVASSLQIVSFIEQRDTPPAGKVVQDWSSQMDHPSERARVIIDAKHQNMTRFKSANDANYRRVQQHIIALVGEARAPRLGQLAQDEDDSILREDMARAPLSDKHSSMITKEAIICHCLPPFTARFYGRDSYVAAIEAYFVGTKKSFRSLALHGMAGVGKTQLALNFATSHRDQYPAIFWVHADQDQKMAQDYDDFAKNLSLDSRGTDGQLQNRAKFKNWLTKEPTSWLLIFDNVDNLASIKPFWPSAGHGSIIVTAKNPEVITSLVQKSIHLEPFSESDGAKYLFSRLSDPSAQDGSLATVIANKLGGLPIALSHVAGFIEATSCTFEEVLDMYSYRADPELVDYDSSEITFDYEESYATMWKVSLESLCEEATHLLELLALLDPDGIPEDLLRDESKAINEKPRVLSEPGKYRKGVSQLRRHALVEKDVRLRTLSIHRLVQEATIRDWDLTKLQSVFNAASECVSQCFPRQIGGASMSKDWEKCAKYTPHLLSLARHYQYAEPPLERSLDFAEVLSHCAWYLYEQGQLDGAFDILLLARDTCNSVLEGQPHLITAHVYNNLSAMYMVQGKRQECADTSLHVCTIREQLLGPDHVHVAQALANHATDLNALDRLEDADEIYRKALRIRELPQNSDTEPELLGQLLSNAGRCWARMCRFPEAENALNKAIELRRQSLGVHNATAISYYGLGNTLLAQGHLNEAMRCHQVCLDMRRELKLTTYWLGVSCHKLAALHHQKGQCVLTADTRKEHNDIAVDLLREAVTNFKQAESEPGLLARSLFKLSSILVEIGDTPDDGHEIPESHRLYNEAIEAAGDALPDNPTEQDYDELVQFDHR